MGNTESTLNTAAAMDFLESLAGDTDIAKAAGEFVESELKSLLISGEEKTEGGNSEEAPKAEGDAPAAGGEKTEDKKEDAAESGEKVEEDKKEDAAESGEKVEE